MEDPHLPIRALQVMKDTYLVGSTQCVGDIWNPMCGYDERACSIEVHAF